MSYFTRKIVSVPGIDGNSDRRLTLKKSVETTVYRLFCVVQVSRFTRLRDKVTKQLGGIIPNLKNLVGIATNVSGRLITCADCGP